MCLIKHSSIDTYICPLLCVGGKAVLCNRWCRSSVHQGWNFARFLQAFLATQDGTGQAKLQTGKQKLMVVLVRRMKINSDCRSLKRGVVGRAQECWMRKLCKRSSRIGKLMNEQLLTYPRVQFPVRALTVIWVICLRSLLKWNFAYWGGTFLPSPL